MSSTKAKYKAMSNFFKEGLWLRCLLEELQIHPRAPIPLHVDNSGAEALSKDPQHHSRTKHINTLFHFVHECVKNKKLVVLHVSTHDMLADILTKLLSPICLKKHCDLGVCEQGSQQGGVLM